MSRDQVREHQRLLARHDIIEKRKEWLEKCNNEQAKVTTPHPSQQCCGTVTIRFRFRLLTSYGSGQCFGSVFIFSGSGSRGWGWRPVRIRIRIQGFNDQKLKKKITAEKKTTFFLDQTAIYLSLGLHKVCPSCRRNLQLSKEAIQHFKSWTFTNFFYFRGSFLPSWIRIRIPNTDPDPLARLNTDPIRIPDPDPKPWFRFRLFFHKLRFWLRLNHKSSYKKKLEIICLFI